MRKFSAECEHEMAASPPQQYRPVFRLIDRLPKDIVMYIFSILSAPELAIVAQTCRSLHLLSGDNFLWRNVYDRFATLNSIAVGLLDPTNIKEQLKRRIEFPQVGDNLEAGWIGKLRTGLSSGNCYGGLTWWKATIVAVNNDIEPIRYLISYDGWRENWQEWVTRKALRWVKKEYDLIHEIELGDSVEYAVATADINICPTGCWLKTVVLEILNNGASFKLRRTHPRIDVHNGAPFNEMVEEFSLDLVVDRQHIRKLKNPFSIL
jgi:hypothetical protein